MSVVPRRWPYTPATPKDPDAILDYRVDWSDWLADGEAIADVAWSIGGATLAASTYTETTATAWVSGGTAGETISLSCKVTTDNAPIARVDERTLIVQVAEQ